MTPSTAEHYLHVIYHRCLRLLQDSDLAWDATQEVMTRFFEKTKHRTIEQPLQYLYRTSTNCSIDILRQNKRVFPTEPDTMEAMLGSETPQPLERLQVEKMAKHFGQEAMTLLIYRYIDRMTYQEIAKLYGISDRGLKKRIDKLKKQIHKYFG